MWKAWQRKKCLDETYQFIPLQKVKVTRKYEQTDEIYQFKPLLSSLLQHAEPTENCPVSFLSLKTDSCKDVFWNYLSSLEEFVPGTLRTL